MVVRGEATEYKMEESGDEKRKNQHCLVMWDIHVTYSTVLLGYSGLNFIQVSMNKTLH